LSAIIQFSLPDEINELDLRSCYLDVLKVLISMRGTQRLLSYYWLVGFMKLHHTVEVIGVNGNECGIEV
jgi:hypothetical protein